MNFRLNEAIRGRVWLFGDSVDSDAINPFYQYPTMEELKKHTLEAFRPEFPREVRQGDIIVAGRNFGCGSHRPGLVLREVGVVAIIVESASRLFLRNNISMPLPIFVAPGITGLVKDGETIELDYPHGRATNVGTGEYISFAKYPPMIEEIFAHGGLPRLARTRYLREHG